MLNKIQNLLRGLSERQAYVGRESYRKNFTEVLSGQTLNGQEPVRYLSGIEFVLPEDSPYNFVETSDDQWGVTLRTENNSEWETMLDTEATVGESIAESPCNDLDFAYELRALHSHDANATQRCCLSLGIEEIDARQRIRIGLIDSQVRFPQSQLHDFRSAEKDTTEIRFASYLTALEDTVLEIELNGKRVIRIKIGDGEDLCSSSLGWNIDEDGAIELSPNNPHHARVIPFRAAE